jgi:hypothetical protein
MDLYSIQNSGGEVYGIFRMSDDIDLPPWEWEGRLTEELADILGINGVRTSPLEVDGVQQDRVVIDIDPYKSTAENIKRVHLAVGFICLTSDRMPNT